MKKPIRVDQHQAKPTPSTSLNQKCIQSLAYPIDEHILKPMASSLRFGSLLRSQDCLRTWRETEVIKAKHHFLRSVKHALFPIWVRGHVCFSHHLPTILSQLRHPTDTAMRPIQQLVEIRIRVSAHCLPKMGLGESINAGTPVCETPRTGISSNYQGVWWW